LLLASQAQVPCDSPFFRHLAAQDWAFPYLTAALFQATDNKICPGYAHTNSCCDNPVYDALEAGWIKLYGEVVSIRVRLGVMQFQVGVLITELNNAKTAINNNQVLTADEKQALLAFINAIINAVSTMVPNILANFESCYSTVLRFYAGMLCKACDPNWQVWINLLNGSDPLHDQYLFNFAQKTCTGFQTACSPFFAPFFAFADAFFTALETLADAIPNNNTRALVLAKIESFDPPCLDNNDCLLYICYKFLEGLRRDESWASESFGNGTTSGNSGRRESVMDGAVDALNEFQRSLTYVSHARPNARSSDGYSGTTYTGNFDPLTQVTTLNTNAESSSAPTLKSWTDLFAF